jgi:hypothetical protein
VITENLTVFLQDFGVPASWAPSGGGATVSGLMIFDMPEDTIMGGEVQSRQYSVRFLTATWPGLKRGEVLAVQGGQVPGQYKLRNDPNSEDDGAFSVVDLTKVG